MGGEGDIHEDTNEQRLWVRGALTRERGSGTIADSDVSGPRQFPIHNTPRFLRWRLGLALGWSPQSIWWQ